MAAVVADRRIVLVGDWRRLLGPAAATAGPPPPYRIRVGYRLSPNVVSASGRVASQA